MVILMQVPTYFRAKLKYVSSGINKKIQSTQVADGPLGTLDNLRLEVHAISKTPQQ
jgi:hypothetical protein